MTFKNVPNELGQLVLLQEFFGEILKVPLGEVDVRGDSELVGWSRSQNPDPTKSRLGRTYTCA